MFHPPPLIWIFFAVLLLISTSILHTFHSTKTVQDTPSKKLHSNGVEMTNLQAYVKKLEEEIVAIETSMAEKLRKRSNAQSPKEAASAGSTLGTLSLPIVLQPAQSTSSISPLFNMFNDKSQLPQATTQLHNGVDATDTAMVSWTDGLMEKLRCLHGHNGGIYLYHARKAAGTTVREALTHIAHVWHIKLFETEGLSLDPDFLQVKALLTVTTLRDPVERILSLYWYEHVGWFDGILKETQKCKSLKVWVDAWRDGTDWKTNFMRKNPRNVYIEIENYYVKMLTGWVGPNPVTEADLDKAKKILEKFDLVLIKEWMEDDSQLSALNAMFPGRTDLALNPKVVGDYRAKERLRKTLAADEVGEFIGGIFNFFCNVCCSLCNIHFIALKCV